MEKETEVKAGADRLKKLMAKLGRPLKRSFFEAPPELVAPQVLGKILAHSTRSGLLAGRIVEVEAYLGPHNDKPDEAAHSHRGPTPRTQVLFGPPGHAYIYAIYGLHFCMNISCEPEGLAGSLLIRALEPIAGIETMAKNRGLKPNAAISDIASGPGKLCQALGLTRQRHNGLDLLDSASKFQVRDDGFAVSEVLVSARIGIRRAAELPLRFALPECISVSGPKSLPGRRVVLS